MSDDRLVIDHARELTRVIWLARDFIEDEIERRNVVGIDENSEYVQEPIRLLALIDNLLTQRREP